MTKSNKMLVEILQYVYQNSAEARKSPRVRGLDDVNVNKSLDAVRCFCCAEAESVVGSLRQACA